MIDVEIDLSANHNGHFELKLCPVNSPKQIATQACMDKHPLYLDDVPTSYKFHIPPETKKKDVMRYQVKLPDGITCRQCVIQWTYITGKRLFALRCNLRSNCVNLCRKHLGTLQKWNIRCRLRRSRKLPKLRRCCHQDQYWCRLSSRLRHQTQRHLLQAIHAPVHVSLHFTGIFSSLY